MTERKPRTPEQAAKNRATVAAKQAARAVAEGRQPGRRGRPPVPCGGCGLKVPKGPNGKCLHCGHKPTFGKKKAEKTCAKQGRV
jgi:rRNA maturation endonuclease Nob1